MTPPWHKGVECMGAFPVRSYKLVHFLSVRARGFAMNVREKKHLKNRWMKIYDVLKNVKPLKLMLT